MSVRLIYVDESHDAHKFCLSGIMIVHRHWHEAFHRAQEHRRNLKKDFGVYIRKEIHARELVSGRGQIAPEVIGKHARSRIFHGLLRSVALIPQVQIINICLDVAGRADPQLDAWDRLVNRIERAMLAVEEREIPLRRGILSKVQPHLSSADYGDLELRLLALAPRAIIFADEGRETEITRNFRKMSVYNPIPSRFGTWEEGRRKNIPVKRIIDDPVFKKSHQSFFIQLADCVAFSLLKRETPVTPNIERYGINFFFDECLANVCLKRASNSDLLGIVRK